MVSVPFVLPLLAGMPSFDLGDVAALRVQGISFFVVLLLASAFAIQRIWNGLRADFTSLPLLSYKRALGLVILWGLLFLLVLTMISGARELMTPGAWRKDGATYKLSPATDEPERRARLESLRATLWSYAEKHQGALPPETAPEVSGSFQVVDHPRAARYVYVNGRKVGEAEPVAFEPGVYGSSRLVLLATGAIELWPAAKLPR